METRLFFGADGLKTIHSETQLTTLLKVFSGITWYRLCEYPAKR